MLPGLVLSPPELFPSFFLADLFPGLIASLAPISSALRLAAFGNPPFSFHFDTIFSSDALGFQYFAISRSPSIKRSDPIPITFPFRTMTLFFSCLFLVAFFQPIPNSRLDFLVFRVLVFPCCRSNLAFFNGDPGVPSP